MAIPDLSHAAQLGFQTGRASAPGNSMGMFIKGLLEHKEKIAETNQKFKQEIALTQEKQRLEEASPKYQAELELKGAQTESALSTVESNKALAEKRRTGKSELEQDLIRSQIAENMAQAEKYSRTTTGKKDRKITPSDVSTFSGLALSEQKSSLFEKGLEMFGTTEKEKARQKYGGVPQDIKDRFRSQFDQTSGFPTFATVEEAEAANLPVGTVVMINGRRAVIE